LHLTDGALLAQAHTHHSHERTATAALLADLAEIEARHLHVASGYSTMRAWCLGELRMSDDAVSDRLQAARLSREYPAILPMLADGRLHLTAVLMVAKHLRRGNASHLLAAIAGRSKPEIAMLLASWFPTTEMLPMVTAPLSVPERNGSSAFVTTDSRTSVPERNGSSAFVTTDSGSSVPERKNVAPAQKVVPAAIGRHLFQFMGDEAQRALLREVQDLLGSQAGGDIGAVFFMALELLKANLERRKHGKTERPRRARRRAGPRGRHVPAEVRRAVYARDGGRCTFVGQDGKRCESRRDLEYDHIVPVARGGESTPSNVRLLCRAHNQFEAERAFGRGFMDGRRESARQGRKGATKGAEAPASDPEAAVVAVAACDPTEDAPNHAAQQHPMLGTAPARDLAEEETRTQMEVHERFLDVIAALSQLGFRTAQARWAAERARTPGATLEQHIRAALKILQPRRGVSVSATAAVTASAS
jgi:5-methylcytosine-specific restriction endonuclease McrA